MPSGTTFQNGGGIVTTDFGGIDNARDMVLQPDGKIILVGDSYSGSSGRFAAARYNSDGSLDTSFDGDGRVTVQGSSTTFGYAAALQADGRLLLGGETYNTSGNTDMTTLRFTATGALDTTFDGDGRVQTNFNGGYDATRSLAVQPDGKIVAAGDNGGSSLLTRYNTNGSLDTTFGGSARLTVYGFRGSDSVTVQPDGKILIVGYRYNGSSTDLYLEPYSSKSYDVSVIRYTANGQFDTTFGSYGYIATGVSSSANDYGTSLVVQADGKIIVAGYSDDVGVGANIFLVRYTSEGRLDTTFGDGGKVITDLGDNEYAQSIALQADGKLVVVGTSGSYGNGDFLVVRYNADGTLDSSFGAGGYVTTGINGDDDAEHVAIQADGKIVVAGTTNAGGGQLDFALVRYHSNGALDNSDSTAPSIISVTPIDESSNVAVASNISVSYSEGIARGNGSIVLREASGTVVATYDAATSSEISMSGATLTINPATDLSPGVSYQLQIDAGAIKDASGNPAAALTTYNFTTQAATVVDYSSLVQKFYVAYFGRPADPGGLANMSATLQQAHAPTSLQAFLAATTTNSTVLSTILSFGNSAESASLYTGGTNEFVTSIFQNVLGRAPQTAGLNFWADSINSGQVTRGEAALRIMAGAESNTSEQGLIDAALLAKRVTVANTFTSAIDTAEELQAYRGSTAAAAARGMLANVVTTSDVDVGNASALSTLATLVNQTARSAAMEGESYDAGLLASLVGIPPDGMQFQL